VRLFFAAWPPPATAAALHEWSKGLQGKATPAANIHLTLAFLGEADAARAIAAARRVRGSRHELPIDTVRYVKRNEMVWVGPRLSCKPFGSSLGSAFRPGQVWSG